MIDVNDFIRDFSGVFKEQKNLPPWKITENLPDIIRQLISTLDHNYDIHDEAAIHKTSTVERGAVLKGPIIISQNCFVASNAYLRGGNYLGNSSIIGPGCEIKTSILLHHSVIAHLNFIADSIIGSDVNFEAGSITANHYNEKVWSEISVYYDSRLHPIHTTKFGSLVGDHSRIGANAVLSPGTLLKPNSIIGRLELIDQSRGSQG